MCPFNKRVERRKREFSTVIRLRRASWWLWFVNELAREVVVYSCVSRASIRTLLRLDDTYFSLKVRVGEWLNAGCSVSWQHKRCKQPDICTTNNSTGTECRSRAIKYTELTFFAVAIDRARCTCLQLASDDKKSCSHAWAWPHDLAKLNYSSAGSMRRHRLIQQRDRARKSWVIRAVASRCSCRVESS
jgi:hypothetical protein